METKIKLPLSLVKTTEYSIIKAMKKDLTEKGLKETDYNGLNVSKIISNAYEKARKKKFFTIIVKPTDDANYKNFCRYDG
ncbi:hypothetical protein [Chryseobacterium indoltheticum]|uniref:hypothetical protein n=1 Tax=Chryseobacterium indoltheticum TaxID=254 RepID=UPI003F498EF3